MSDINCLAGSSVCLCDHLVIHSIQLCLDIALCQAHASACRWWSWCEEDIEMGAAICHISSSTLFIYVSQAQRPEVEVKVDVEPHRPRGLVIDLLHSDEDEDNRGGKTRRKQKGRPRKQQAAIQKHRSSWAHLLSLGLVSFSNMTKESNNSPLLWSRL